MATIRKCALIARVSTVGQAMIKEGSIPTQLGQMRAHIDYKNNLGEDDSEKWEEASTYVLEGVSGSKSIQSEEFLKLYRDIGSGAVNTVLCTRLDRVSRSIRDFIEFFDFLKLHNVDFVSVSQQIDTTSHYGRFITFILMALAELEREQTSERMKVSKKARAVKGRWTGGITLLGYDLGVSKGELVVNTDEANLVQQIFSAYMKFGSVRKVAAYLNEKGYRTKTRTSQTGNVRGGLRFKSEIVRRILRSKEYIGILPINKRNVLKNQEELKDHERYIEVEASWASIVDEEMFYGVQALLDEGRASRHSSVAPRRHTYLLAGLLHCGSCLQKMNAESTKKSEEKRYFRYVCNNNKCKLRSVPAGKIEDAVVKSVSELAFKPEILSRIIEETNNRMTADVPRLQKELKVRKRSLSKVSNKIKTLMYSHSEVEEDAQLAIADELDKKSKQKAEIELAIARLESRITDCASSKVVAEAVVVALDKFSSSISVLNNREKKKLIESVVNKVYWDGKMGLRIAIYGNSAFSNSDSLTRNEKCAESHDWRLEEDLNLRPSG